MSNRFNQNIIKIKNDIMKKKKYGKLLQIKSLYYGGIIHNGIHVLDTLQFLFNQKLNLKEIYEFSLYNKKKYRDYNVNCKLNFKSIKSKVYINYFNEDNYQIYDIDILFQKYRLQINNFSDEIRLYKRHRNNIKENVLKPYLSKVKKDEKNTHAKFYSRNKKLLIKKK